MLWRNLNHQSNVLLQSIECIQIHLCLDTKSCDNVCQWLASAQWFCPGTQVSSTNKTDHHDKTEILLKVAFNTINLTKPFVSWWTWFFNESFFFLLCNYVTVLFTLHGNMLFIWELKWILKVHNFCHYFINPWSTLNMPVRMLMLTEEVPTCHLKPFLFTISIEKNSALYNNREKINSLL